MKNLIYIISFICCCNLFSQQKIFNGDPDEAFEKARNLAFNNQRKQAQDSLAFILTKYPNYHDIRSFLASTYSWDGNYKKAKELFEYVLKNDPDRLDTWEAAIKNELYSEAPFNALKMADKALEYFPNNTEILYLKASAQEDTNKKEEALITIESLLKQDPNHEKALAYKNSLLDKLSNNALGISASIDLYSDVFDPMQLHLLKYVRLTKYGGIHTKLNFGRRFQSNGLQMEVDLYPSISKGFYAYLNFGFSNSFLFPDFRYGAELYKSLPHSLEASLGFRALKYDETTAIYTGSVGWYTGNDYWSLRSYLTPGDAGTSLSGTLTYRKYRSNADNFITAIVGMGFSPEIYPFQFEGVNNPVVNLKSQKVNIGYYFTSKTNKHAYGIQTGVTHQEISFDPGNYFWIYSLVLTWDMKFK